MEDKVVVKDKRGVKLNLLGGLPPRELCLRGAGAAVETRPAADG